MFYVSMKGFNLSPLPFTLSRHFKDSLEFFLQVQHIFQSIFVYMYAVICIKSLVCYNQTLTWPRALFRNTTIKIFTISSYIAWKQYIHLYFVFLVSCQHYVYQSVRLTAYFTCVTLLYHNFCYGSNFIDGWP